MKAVCGVQQVTLGIWQATAAQDIIGKIFGVYFPVLAFVAIGFGAALCLAAFPAFAFRVLAFTPCVFYFKFQTLKL
jgi:formate/nitrite transporter FocA (FNT family)